MTSHGFIGIWVASDRSGVAKEVSEKDGVVAAHVVTGWCYNIIAEIDLRKHTRKHGDLLAEIHKINGIQKTDLLIIQDSYVKGERIPEEEGRRIKRKRSYFSSSSQG